MKPIEELESQIAEAKTRIGELESAVVWVTENSHNNNIDPRWIMEELHARAFPPKFETVEVDVYLQFKDSKIIDFTIDINIAKTWNDSHGYSVITATIPLTIPILRKVKHREEIVIVGKSSRIDFDVVAGSRYYREWETDK